MPDAFDPYFKWLGIPKADQPPHAYRLLGIELFESDADVISNAADGRMAQIKSFQTGKYGAVSQKLLNEIAAAKVCLLKPEKKAEYDRRLRAHLQRKNAAESVKVQEPPIAEAIVAPEENGAGLAFLDFAAVTKRSATRPVAREKKTAWVVPVGIAVSVLIVLAGVIAFVSFSGNDKEKLSKGQIALQGDGNHGEAKASANPAEKPASSGSGERSKTTGESALAKDSGHLPTAQPTDAGPQPKPKREEPGIESKPDIEPPPETVKTPEDEKPKETAEKPADTPPADQNPSKQEPAKKSPMPDQAQYQAMKAKILNIYRKEFTEAKTAEAKLALAAKLEALGDTSKGEPAERYALWRIAAEKASEAGEFSAAIGIGDKIETNFDGDGEAIKAELLASGAAHAAIAPDAARNLCETAVKLAIAAVGRDDFEFATKYAKLAGGSARKVKDPQFVRDVAACEHEIERRRTRYGLAAKALETLKDDADNPQANLTVGQWYCFLKGEWDKGLSYLAKGSREDLAAVAKQELAKPANTKAQAAVADAWWAIGEKDRSEKAAYRARAVYWYEQAAPGLTGLEKVRVEKLIDSTKQASAGGPAPKSYGARGVVQQGNVALLSNGTAVVGPTEDRDVMLGDKILTGRATQAKTPCEFTITFATVYQLQQIRMLFYANGAYPYSVLVSRDGRRFDLLEDHSKEKLAGWQDLRFSPRPVKAIKLVYPTEGYVEVAKFEAYCYLITGSAGSNPHAGRGAK